MGKSARPTRPVAPARSAFREVASASAIRLLYARARCGGMGAASLRPSAPFEVPRTPFGVRDPLLQLSFPLPTAAVPRERPFSRGSLTGALGQDRSHAGGVQSPRVGVAWLDFIIDGLKSNGPAN